MVSGFSSGIGGADFDLDRFGRALADQQVVLALEVLHDGFVHLVAGHADGTRVDDAAQRDDGDVGGAAADVDDHVAGRLGDGQAGADRGGHGLLDEINFAGARAVGGVLHGALFDRRDLAGDADDDARVDAARGGCALSE